jgi:hypothetical protein
MNILHAQTRLTEGHDVKFHPVSVFNTSALACKFTFDVLTLCDADNKIFYLPRTNQFEVSASPIHNI